MPGGKIAVYTGIIEKIQITDDELAAVMGHEISHALREHGRERASQQVATGVGASLAGAVAEVFLPGSGQVGTGLAGVAGQVPYVLPYSRIHETEADRMGVELAARAGYDPRAAIALWPKTASKTTLFNCLSRLYTASAGAVSFEGAPLLRQPAHKIVGLGIGRTFQNLALFPTQSVLQNVMVGAHCRTSSDFLSNALKLGWVAREEGH